MAEDEVKAGADDRQGVRIFYDGGYEDIWRNLDIRIEGGILTLVGYFGVERAYAPGTWNQVQRITMNCSTTP